DGRWGRLRGDGNLRAVSAAGVEGAGAGAIDVAGRCVAHEVVQGLAIERDLLCAFWSGEDINLRRHVRGGADGASGRSIRWPGHQAVAGAVRSRDRIAIARVQRLAARIRDDV